MVPPAIDRHRVSSISCTSPLDLLAAEHHPVAVQVDDELGGVLPAAHAEQLGHARLRAGTLAGQRAQGGADAEQRADRRQGDRVADPDLLGGRRRRRPARRLARC